MYKNIFTYLLLLTLLTSVVVPTCLSFSETTYELSVEFDIEEEAEKTKDIEVKMFETVNEFLPNTFFVNKSGVVYFPKKYNSIHLNLDSPPPRF